jgi:hypothetical protein
VTRGVTAGDLADEMERMRCLIIELVACLDDGSIAVLPGLKDDGQSVCHHDARCGCAQAVVERDASRIAAAINARAKAGG